MTLPEFLLAWADSKATWLGLKKFATPTLDQRWTFPRTVTIVAFCAAFGAGLGSLIGLLAVHEPLGWLAWLLGLWMGVGSLCWHGVTALSWNQRVARLRADPTTPVSLSKAAYPFLRWCLGFVYFLLLAVVTPLALMITIENTRAEIIWKRTVARLEAAGEKLTMRDLLGAEIAPELNAGAAPIFAPFFDYRLEKPKWIQLNGEDKYVYDSVWPQSNAIARLENAFKKPTAYPRKAALGSEKQPKTPRIDLAEWAAAYRAAAVSSNNYDKAWATQLGLPKSGSPVEVVKAGLAPAEPFLEEICAAAALPRARFPGLFEEGYHTMARHLGMLKMIQETLMLQCAIHLQSGETEAAFAAATNAVNVAELLREEPLLISQLVRYAQMNVAIRGFWQGLAEHRWNDEQLALFQKRLSGVDYLPGMISMLEGERVCGITGMEQMLPRPGGSGDPHGMQKLGSHLSRSVLRQNQTVIALSYTRMINDMRERTKIAPSQGLLPLVRLAYGNWMDFLPDAYSPYSAVAKMLFPALDKAWHRTARAQALVRLAIVACALERYHLAHGRFPDSLDTLAPNYVDAVPLDPMTLKPFHYKPTDDGWFLLYSVGVNGTDDQGVMQAANANQGKEEKDWTWPVPTRPTFPKLF